MKKSKKILGSIGLFFTGVSTKVSAFTDKVQTKYGISDPTSIQDKYGVFEPIAEPKYGVFDPESIRIENKIATIGKYAIPIILFFIGLFVILSKKTTKRVKAIVITILVLIGVIGVALMNYLSNRA